jgi:hypothetical protein
MRRVRRATINDSDDLFLLLKALHAESIFHSIPIDENRLKAFVTFCIDHPSHVCIFYENVAAKIDGILLGYIQPYFFRASWVPGTLHYTFVPNAAVP